jgi:glycerophosphoryl diester phosphodiesterase
MFHPLDGLGELGERVPGPPWILGRRGVPAVAPENTLASLSAALELGLDGVSYELRACASGELVLLADADLDRTSDAQGPVAVKTLRELAGVDAGSWFDRRFAHEPLALAEEALELAGPVQGVYPMHLIELPTARSAAELARVLSSAEQRLSVRVASRSREVCRELRDLGLQTMLLVHSLRDEDLEFVHEQRLSAVAATDGAWRGSARDANWNCERWALSVDDPEELLRCARAPLTALSTHEPLRALAARALARFAPHDEGGWPIEPIELDLDGANALAGGRASGEWSGAWDVQARVRNPFGFAVQVAVGLRVRRGAFDVQGLPAQWELAPGESRSFAFRLSGGSWSPGGDPLLVAALRWSRGPGRPQERLFFDTPLLRMRRARVGEGALRLILLHEKPGDPPASVTLRCRRDELQVAIESAGGLSDAGLLVSLAGVRHRGGPRLRLELPPEARGPGVAFSVGVVGREGKQTRLRRWAGGLPDELEAGAPGRLLVDERG